MGKIRERNIQTEYAQFQDLMEKHFAERIEIDDKTMSIFNEELNKMNISEEDLGSRYSFFITRNYRLRVDADMTKPLYKDRNYALKIHNKIFYDIFAKNNEPLPEKARITNKGIVMDLCGIIGDTGNVIYDEIDKISNSELPVLITGETGTGKELYAKAIHYLSPCRKEILLPINCSGIPDSLLESELFGHEKGAFTGAIKKKIGLFEKVGKGTLFLDEVSGMSMNLQAKLLRVLQDGDFRRIGGEETNYFKGRIIAATNMDLKSEISKGNFKSDLFYRLNVLSLELRPLREMPDQLKFINITAIMHERIKAERGFKIGVTIALPDDTRECLLKYNYPGNYRELSHILLKAFTLSEGNPIEMKFLPVEVKNYKSHETLTECLLDKSNSPKNIKLVDVFHYADSVAASIIKSKVEEIHKGGNELKRVLKTEMGKDFTDSRYQTLRSRLEKTLGGKGSLKALRNKCKIH